MNLPNPKPDPTIGEQLAARARRLSWLIGESKVRVLTDSERGEIEQMFGKWEPQR